MTEKAVIDCEHLELGYGGKALLHDIDIHIERCEIVAIVGGSGSGKSTVLKSMVGLLPPMVGTVRLFGQDLYALDDESRAVLVRRTGTLFQQGALFGSLTVIENVMLPLRELTDLPSSVMAEMARIKLELVDLSGLEDRLPAQISGGQRKRVALARAIALDPEIVFCDEPTSGLDPVVAATVDDMLRRLRDASGITIVAVTHDIDTVRAVADRVIMLADGRIRAAGSVADLDDAEDADIHAFFHRLPHHDTAAPPRQRIG